jgi:hypothetical protein
VWAISWIPFLIVYRQKRASLASQETIVKNFISGYWKEVLMLIALFVFLYVALIVFNRPNTFGEITYEEFNVHFEGDKSALIYIDSALDKSIEKMKDEGYFDMDKADLLLNRASLVDSWEELIENAIELDLIKNKYKGFTSFNLLKRSREHSLSFLMAYSAFISEQKMAIRLMDLVNENETLMVILDESTGNSIPANSYSTIKARLNHADELVKLNAGRLYLPVIKRNVVSEIELLEIINDGFEIIDGSIFEYSKVIAKRPLDFLERKAFDLWFPVQTQVAKQISYIRVTDRDYFITPEILEKHIEKFQPGDIMLERREWHATNVGIPGYWTHAAMYIGTMNELDIYFNDEFEKNKVSDQIRNEYPKVYSAMLRNDEFGFPMRVIEAKRPGVIVASLENSGGGDALGVLRVKNVSKAEQLEVLMNAFSHYGKPYDYNFNFATNNALVCSELIYKSYLSNEFLELELEDFNGRSLYSPNSFAKKFTDELGQTGQQLDLILFIDSDSKKNSAKEKFTDEFIETWKRPKWHIVTERI